MRLADLQGRRLLVLGLGDDVSAALDVAMAAGPTDVVIVDADPARAEARLLAQHPALAGRVDVLADVARAPRAEVALRSPGFPLYEPALQQRLQEGLVTTTPLDLWVNERGDGPMVALTGTKGKSSTAVLICMALQRLGRPARVLGNIGVPPWTCPPTAPEVAVLEVSSYQAADLSRTAPLGALTALGEDHVDWHGSLERYYRDKARVFLALAAEPRWYGVPADLELPPAFAEAGLQPVEVPPQDARRRNAVLAAATALQMAGEGNDPPALDELSDALARSYPSLPGRMSSVARVGGVDYIDDSLASNPLGLAAAVRSVQGRPATVIVGGHDRGAGTGQATAAVAARGTPICLLWLDEGSALAEALGPWCSTVEAAGSLEEAVARAAMLTPAGGAVVFSPGMPTPAQQGNWAARSERFRLAVAALGGGR